MIQKNSLMDELTLQLTNKLNSYYLNTNFIRTPGVFKFDNSKLEYGLLHEEPILTKETKQTEPLHSKDEYELSDFKKQLEGKPKLELRNSFNIFLTQNEFFMLCPKLKESSYSLNVEKNSLEMLAKKLNDKNM